MQTSDKATHVDYINSNLLRLSPTPVKLDAIFTIKIHGEEGQTNWLNISGKHSRKLSWRFTRTQHRRTCSCLAGARNHH